MRMKPFAIAVAFAVATAVLGLLCAAGCSKSEPQKTASRSTNSSTPQTQQQAPPPAAHEPGHADEHEAAAPAGSVQELWSQISAEQTKLEEVIRAGRLAEVHHLAFAIRDLSVAAAGKSPSSAKAAKMEETLTQIKKSASALDEFGDSGNLGGVKKEYASFQQELATLKSLAGGL